MSEQRRANVITVRYRPDLAEDAVVLTHAGTYGNECKRYIDGIVGIGRSVTAFALEDGVYSELENKSRSQFRAILDDVPQRRLQSWADRQVRGMQRRLGTEHTKVISDFRSKEEARNSERTVQIGGYLPGEYTDISFRVARALRELRYGDFRLAINTDFFSRGHRDDHNSYFVFGMGNGTGDDATGSWMPFYDARNRAIDQYSKMRSEGAPYVRAIGSISFAHLAQEAMARVNGVRS